MSHKFKYFKNILVIILIFGFTFTPYFDAVEYAYAQTGGIQGGSTQSGGYNSGGAYGGGGISGYIKGLGPAIIQLPGCKKKIKGAYKKLFKFSAAAKEATAQVKESAAYMKGLTKELDLAQATSNNIPVSDEQTRKILQEYKVKLENIESSTQSLDENETCMNGIAKMVIKLMIQKLTLETANWIRTGVRGDGGPAFVQNPGKFFKDIYRDELLQFAGEIKGNPYGKGFLQMQAAAFNNKFAQNAQFSLNELIKETTPQYSSVSFNTNFTYGGWSAWNFMTQVPANNPIGFQVMSSNELSKRLEGTYQSTAKDIREDLTRAGGYLGDNRCANPEGLSLEAHKTALEANVLEMKPGTNTPTGYIVGTCRRWEYVTPGKMIAESASKVTDFVGDNYLGADTINDAVATLIDAVLARFSSELMNKGFADFSNEGSNGAFVMNFDEANGNGAYTQTEKDYSSHLLNSSWLKENPDFNIRTDLTQAMIDEQRIYITKLEDQNVAIEHIIKTIRQLDYCIPGPNPNWEESSSVEEFYRSIKVSPKAEMSPLAQGLLSFDPTGIISGIANAIFDDDAEKDLKKNIAIYLGRTLDVYIDDKQDQVLDESGIRSVLENTFESYRNIIYRVYFAGSKSFAPMPQVTAEARGVYDEIVGYEQMVATNLEVIPLRRGIVTRLAQIKEAVEALNIQYGNGPTEPPTDDTTQEYAQYEAALKDWKAYFGRLTRDMVTGDNIAEVDNVLKEIIDKDDYIYKNLLLGPGGCEKEMEDLYKADPIKYSKYIRRQPYLFPVYYFYGNPVKPAGSNPNDPPPPSTNTTKYFGSSGPAGGGTWVGDGTAGTWWTGTSGQGKMIMTNMDGQGTYSGAGISGTWNITGSSKPTTPPNGVGGTWSGTSGSGTYIGSCTNTTPPGPNGTCSGTWGGGNGQGINGGGYAPMSGVAYGDLSLTSQSIGGNWTLQNNGTGSWYGTTKTTSGGSSFSLGTWQVSGNGGGFGLNTGIGQWFPGSAPGSGPAPDPNGPCTTGPCEKIPWNENLIDGWDPNQGFAYGMVYTNKWAGPYPPKAPANLADLCPDEFFYEMFPNYAEVSLPLPDGTDIGGLDVAGGVYSIPGDNNDFSVGPNTCGVITRQFEKIFKIF